MVGLILASLLLQGPITTTPVPRDVSNSQAQGWQNGGPWLAQHEEIVRLGATRPQLVLLGDSITQGWGGEERAVWQVAPEAWERYFAPRKAANFGISGDGTQHVLWRIANGEFAVARPKVVVVMIGVNNVPSSSPEDIGAGVRAVVQKLHEVTPNSKVLLLGLLPFGKEPNAPTRQKVRQVNEILAAMPRRSWFRYLDLSRAFLLSNGEANADLMASDFLHLRPAGYAMWARAMEPTLSRMLNVPAISVR